MLTKLLAAAALLALSLAASVLTLTLGWRLEPHNWTAIVLIGFFGQLAITALVQKFLEENKE